LAAGAMTECVHQPLNWALLSAGNCFRIVKRFDLHEFALLTILNGCQSLCGVVFRILALRNRILAPAQLVVLVGGCQTAHMPEVGQGVPANAFPGNCLVSKKFEKVLRKRNFNIQFILLDLEVI